MSAADIQAAAFTDDNIAREAIETLMWPHGPVCPHCGCPGQDRQDHGQVSPSRFILLRLM